MRRVAAAALFLLVCPIALAQMHGHVMHSSEAMSPCTKELAPAVLQDEFQKVYWPAVMDKLKDSAALPFFRQGLTQYYGLNYEEAMRNFKKAKAVDPTLAMASWGIALAAGPNINLGMDRGCHELACTEIERADRLAGAGTPPTLEQALIRALKQRYVCPVKVLSEDESKAAATNYSTAMDDIWKTRQKDQNVSTLYAESMMDLHPWDLYDKDGVAKPWTGPIVEVLKGATGDVPETIGANHYYIHATEGSIALRKNPRQAEGSANQLQIQVPASGHLVHMSSHIYLLLGDYRQSLDVNIKGANNDVRQYGLACSGPYKQYTNDARCPPLYYGHYLSHNYFFGSVSATFLGRSKDAIGLACQTRDHVQRFVAYEPGLQRYLTAPLTTMVVNRNWDAVCAETNCEATNPSEPQFQDCYSQGSPVSPCNVLRAIWYWARGMTRVAKGKDASADSKAMNEEIKKIPFCDEKTRGVHNTFGNNCARDVLEIGVHLLDARRAWAQATENGRDDTFKALKRAVDKEDNLIYDEPPQWFTPAREALGGAYLQAAQAPGIDAELRIDFYQEAVWIFSAAVERHPASGRALYGVWRAMHGLAASQTDTRKARNEFCDAWTNEGRGADYTMTDADLWPAWDNKAETTVVFPCNTELKEVLPPSNCACQTTPWPPPSAAADRLANDTAVLKCK